MILSGINISVQKKIPQFINKEFSITLSTRVCNDLQCIRLYLEILFVFILFFISSQFIAFNHYTHFGCISYKLQYLQKQTHTYTERVVTILVGISLWTVVFLINSVDFKRAIHYFTKKNPFIEVSFYFSLYIEQQHYWANSVT